MREFTAKSLMRKTSFRILTGVSAREFTQMVARLRRRWVACVEDVRIRSGRPLGVGGLEDHLLVMLVLYRCHITQDFLGMLYDVDKATICRALHRIEPIAARILGVRKDIVVSKDELASLIIDCTEQPVQRPKHEQKQWYSGKKKRHCIKSEIMITPKGRIVSVSDAAPGSVHDITIRKQGPPIPEETQIYADSGYQGLQNDHRNIELPYKKTNKKPLDDDEKYYNTCLSRFRVKVEHTFAKIKTFRIMADRFRYRRDTWAQKFTIIAGIVNLKAGF